MGPGRDRPPNAFWCNLQPKICKSVKVLHTCKLCTWAQDIMHKMHYMHKTPMQHFITFFPECRFCPCCMLLQWVWTESGCQVHYLHFNFETKFFINGAIKWATLLARPSRKILWKFTVETPRSSSGQRPSSGHCPDALSQAGSITGICRPLPYISH